MLKMQGYGHLTTPETYLSTYSLDNLDRIVALNSLLRPKKIIENKIRCLRRVGNNLNDCTEYQN